MYLEEIMDNGIEIASIDKNPTFCGLADVPEVYSKLLKGLKENGWCRFAAGFKAGLYGKKGEEWCIKLIGMGVGQDPWYFLGKNDNYLLHERNMLYEFSKAKFGFQPKIMSKTESVEYLQKQGIDSKEAKDRVYNDDLIIIEFIKGIPLATRTGNKLELICEYEVKFESTKNEIINALTKLKNDLVNANSYLHELVHNDPLPPNIILTKRDNIIEARLIDFELAQKLKNYDNPYHVNVSIEKQYIDRMVPKDPNTGIYIKNLDQHLINETIDWVTKELSYDVSNFSTTINYLNTHNNSLKDFIFELIENRYPTNMKIKKVEQNIIKRNIESYKAELILMCDADDCSNNPISIGNIDIPKEWYTKILDGYNKAIPFAKFISKAISFICPVPDLVGFVSDKPKTSNSISIEELDESKLKYSSIKKTLKYYDDWGSLTRVRHNDKFLWLCPECRNKLLIHA